MKPLQHITTVFLILGVLFANTLKAQVDADFSVDIQQGCAPLVVNFEDLSLGSVDTYFWDFGDGNIDTAANPVHTFASPGTYTVALHVTGGGAQDSFILSNFIAVYDSLPLVVTWDSIARVSCRGNDGNIQLHVDGNNLGNVQFDWSNGVTQSGFNQTFNNGLTVGSYTVTITASNYSGCSFIKSYNVTNQELTYNEVINPPSSCNSLDGAINISYPMGGNSPYFYDWSSGQTSRSISGLSSGVYYLTIEDINSCITIDTFHLISNSLGMNYIKEDVSCFGENDGLVELNGSGGVSPYEYGLTPSFTSSNGTFNNLSAGTHTFYIEDANGCLGDTTVIIEEPDPLQIYESVQHASCNTCSDGWAMVDSLAGGTPPYSYSWSNNETTSSISALLPGTYQVSVEDANGCERVQIFTVAVDSSNNNGCGFNVTQNITPESACSTGDGAVEVISSADPFATYNWSNGSTDNLIDNLNSGFYSVIVTDSNNCSETFTYFVPTNQIITQIGTVNNECHGDDDGVVEFQTTGDIPPYTYTLLASGDTSMSPNGRFDNLPAGTYTVEIESSTGCVTYEDFIITEPAPIQISGVVQNTSCGTCADGSIDLTVLGGVIPYSYQWIGFGSTEDLNNVPQGEQIVIVSDANGCFATDTFFVDDSTSCVDCVWPGDANSDGVADNDDVLAIGIGYGISGSARPNASLNWVAQQSPDWGLALASGANLKHVDCNGDALIDSTDMDAVSLNYGFTHNKAEINGDKKVDAHLYYTFTDDTVFAGQEVELQVNYGRDSLPANNIYGIAFSMTFDSSFIEPNSLGFNANNSWMGTNGSDLLDFSKNLYAENRMDAAITKTDQLNVSGYGQIGIFNFTMKDDISGKQLVSLLNLGFSDVKVIDRNENQKSVFYEESSLVIKANPTGISGVETHEIELYPNPASDRVLLQNGTTEIERINIYDLSGSNVISEDVSIASYSNYALNISPLSKGVYLLETLGSDSRGIQKLVVLD